MITKECGLSPEMEGPRRKPNTAAHLMSTVVDGVSSCSFEHLKIEKHVV